MMIKTIISERPNCIYCGKPLQTWSPFGKIHHHIKCRSEEISDTLISIIKKQLNNT